MLLRLPSADPDGRADESAEDRGEGTDRLRFLHAAGIGSGPSSLDCASVRECHPSCSCDGGQ